ncbi:MAG TPA: methyltransferase domain-containing protein [Polyangiaceae bacterium]|jgi:trans-aconitate 2-methyltransferase
MTQPKSPWDPAQYERFKGERSRPFFDLLALVRPRPGMRVVDLGCGTGELTRELHLRLGAAETVGVDSSESMLASSASFAGEGLRFERGAIEAWAPHGELDLIFSNAALQWVEDHPSLLARLRRALRAGGQLAVQVPANQDHPSHAAAQEVAREAPFRDVLEGFERTVPNLKVEEYRVLLDRLGFVDADARLQVYGHSLASRDEVVEWVKGTFLTDYARRMPADLYVRFLDRYRELLLPRLEDQKPYFYPFKRILFWGEVGEGRDG